MANARQFMAARTGAWSSRALPYLRRVDYLENVGSQYIDTGWHNDWDAGFLVTIVFTLDEIGSRKCLCSSYNANNHVSFEINNSGSSRYYATTVEVSVISGIVVGSKQMTSFGYDNGVWKHTLNSTERSGYSEKAGASNLSCNLFVDKSLRYNTFSQFRMHSCKIESGGILIRDFIPVLDLSGRPAMYDKVSGQLFYNQGNGEFAWGELGE